MMSQRIRDFTIYFVQLRPCSKFYALAGMLFSIYLVITIPFTLFGQTSVIKSIAQIIVPVCIALLTCAFLIESTRLICTLWEHKWFKVLFAFLTFSSYSVAKIQADRFINEFTSLDPATLPQAQILLTSFVLVPSWMVVLLVIVVVYMLLSIVFFPVQTITNRDELLGLKRMGRIVGVLGVIALLTSILETYRDDASMINTLMKEVVLLTEYHPQTHCKNITGGYLVAEIGRGYISIFSRKSMEFTTLKCRYN